jgi:hypothetical protein
MLLPAVLLFSKSAPRGAIVSLDREAGQVRINIIDLSYLSSMI